MAILSDFTTIVGDNTVQIGDGDNSTGWTKSFNTAARNSSQTAFISFMVRGMTESSVNADVFVNDVKVGVLYRNSGGNPNHWATQSISLGGSQLEAGNNVLRVESVPYSGGSDGDNLDDYYIRNVICHFHQNS